MLCSTYIHTYIVCIYTQTYVVPTLYYRGIENICLIFTCAVAKTLQMRMDMQPEQSTTNLD